MGRPRAALFHSMPRNLNRYPRFASRSHASPTRGTVGYSRLFFAGRANGLQAFDVFERLGSDTERPETALVCRQHVGQAIGTCHDKPCPIGTSLAPLVRVSRPPQGLASGRLPYADRRSKGVTV